MKVKNLFDEIKILMAESIFDFSCQVPLNANDTILVINFLKNNCQVTTDASALVGLKGYVESHYMYLIMAVLYCFDCSYFDNRQKSNLLII